MKEIVISDKLHENVQHLEKMEIEWGSIKIIYSQINIENDIVLLKKILFSNYKNQVSKYILDRLFNLGHTISTNEIIIVLKSCKYNYYAQDTIDGIIRHLPTDMKPIIDVSLDFPLFALSKIIDYFNYDLSDDFLKKCLDKNINVVDKIKNYELIKYAGKSRDATILNSALNLLKAEDVDVNKMLSDFINMAKKVKSLSTYGFDFPHSTLSLVLSKIKDYSYEKQIRELIDIYITRGVVNNYVIRQMISKIDIDDAFINKMYEESKSKRVFSDIIIGIVLAIKPSQIEYLRYPLSIKRNTKIRYISIHKLFELLSNKEIADYALEKYRRGNKILRCPPRKDFDFYKRFINRHKKLYESEIIVRKII